MAGCSSASRVAAAAAGAAASDTWVGSDWAVPAAAAPAAGRPGARCGPGCAAGRSEAAAEASANGVLAIAGSAGGASVLTAPAAGTSAAEASAAATSAAGSAGSATARGGLGDLDRSTRASGAAPAARCTCHAVHASGPTGVTCTACAHRGAAGHTPSQCNTPGPARTGRRAWPGSFLGSFAVVVPGDVLHGRARGAGGQLLTLRVLCLQLVQPGQAQQPASVRRTTHLCSGQACHRLWQACVAANATQAALHTTQPPSPPCEAGAHW